MRTGHRQRPRPRARAAGQRAAAGRNGHRQHVRRRRCCWPRLSGIRTSTPAPAPAPGSTLPAAPASARCCGACSNCMPTRTTPLARIGGLWRLRDRHAGRRGAAGRAGAPRHRGRRLHRQRRGAGGQGAGPHVVQRCVSAHRSGEPGHRSACATSGRRSRLLGPRPAAGRRLRRGARLAAAESACRILREMASFESAGVSGKDGADERRCATSCWRCSFSRASR